MFCAPITLLHYFEEYKTGGVVLPLPSEIKGGGQNSLGRNHWGAVKSLGGRITPRFDVLKVL